MKIEAKNIVLLSCIACIVACISDFVVMFILGNYYPGYSQLKNTMSALGASVSPVSNEMSACWIIVGVLFIFFGVGFKQAFKDKGANSTIASWLIVLYGFGEGIGSGAFKADHLGNSLTTAAMIHDALGGVGVVAVLILPLIMKKIISKSELPGFYVMSSVVFISGVAMLLLFSFRFFNDNNNFLNIYKGLWQRLMMLNNYIYLTVIAIIMFRKVSYASADLKENI